MTETAPPRRWLRTFAIVVALQGLAALAFLAVERERSAPAPDASFAFERVATRASLPAVDLVRSDGSVVRTAALRGEMGLLHFWATWCPPCRAELPGLLELGREAGGVRVLAVTVDRDWGPVREFFGGTILPATIPPDVLRDPSGTLAKTYEINALPDTYLLDAAGAAILRFGGARDWRSPRAREVLRNHALRAP